MLFRSTLSIVALTLIAICTLDAQVIINEGC